MIADSHINLFNFGGHSNMIHMDFKFFFSGIKNIILNPEKVLGLSDSANNIVKSLRKSHIFPLVFLVTVSSFAGSLIFTNSEQSVLYSVFVAIRCFCSLYLAIYLSALVLKEITYPLDLGRDFNISLRIIAYSVTPFLLCQILSSLLESLLFINVIASYGLYIFWLSAEKLLNAPKYKMMPLLIATLLSTTGIFVATNLILTWLTDKIYFAFFV
jgi:hypothetical protein